MADVSLIIFLLTFARLQELTPSGNRRAASAASSRLRPPERFEQQNEQAFRSKSAGARAPQDTQLTAPRWTTPPPGGDRSIRTHSAHVARLTACTVAPA